MYTFLTYINKKHSSSSTLKTSTIATAGFSIDMTMYKGYDFRCLKPKAGVPSEKWPHYEMQAFRAAKTKEELKKVEEIPFDKYFYNFEDPEVLDAFTDGSDKGLELWRETFGFDWAQWTQGNKDISMWMTQKEH